MVKIIVDSTSDIPQEEAARLGITVVPLTVRFGTEEYRDGVDLMPAEFFKKFAASKELPTTSQVSSGVFMDVFREQLAGKDDEIVALLFTHRLSGTYQSACIARNTFPRRKIFVVESGTGSFGIWLLVKEAVKMRDAGCSAGEIAARRVTGARQGWMSEVLFDEGVECCLIAGASALINHFALSESDDRGNAADAVLCGHARRLVDVVLGDDGAAVEGFGCLFKTRRKHAAGAAPSGPKVNENRRF